jgi:argininosuccinate lyase
MARKLWGGRFRTPTDPSVERYTSSIQVDWRLAPYDVLGSIAHATMLGRCGILSKAEATRLVRGLQQIKRLIEQGRFTPDPHAEDVHSQIQAMLTQRVGAVGEKLHTARSRNDQVALDLRLYCRDMVQRLDTEVSAFQRALVQVAGAHTDVVIPGYTHLQQAQPVLLAHHLLAYVEMLQRDRDRLRDGLVRIDVLPLGSGALAGTSLPIDRRIVAKLLGFARISENSLDAVSDRDFAIELLATLALLAVHLSRFAEDVVLWTTEEFGLAELDDAFATGSSLMPQKKNPDVLELVRGQAGVVCGNLLGLLTVVKGLPLSYNRDLQWDKPLLFQAVEQTLAALEVLEPLVRHLRIHRAQAARLVRSDTLCATDLAEFLVRKGVPFAIAHRVVGGLVAQAEQRGVSLRGLSRAEFRRASPHFDGSVATLLDPRASVARKRSAGSTNPQYVKRALAKWHSRLK